MVFARHLRKVADAFRARYLDSRDDNDKTPYTENWRKMKVCNALCAEMIACLPTSENAILFFDDIASDTHTWGDHLFV